MNLKDIYSKADLHKLIVVMESQSDYTSECIRVVKKEIEKRRPLPESVKKIATEEYIVKMKNTLLKFNPSEIELIIPESYFLDKETINEIAKEELNLWIEKKKSYGFDVLKYSICGM